MNSSAEPGRPNAGAPEVSHVDMLKALADPLRLNILYRLTRRRGAELPARTVKELAAELGEPQTKLYRHIKHLESAGLIRAVSSRIVSGIVEQRYQITRTDQIMGDDLSDVEKGSPEAEAMAAAGLELYRREFFAERRAKTARAGEAPRHRRMLLAFGDGHLSAAQAAVVYDRLLELLDEVVKSDEQLPAKLEDEADRVPVNLLIGYFSPEEPSE
jgi:DNA-binding transcriptional ArsR family regulator